MTREEVLKVLERYSKVLTVTKRSEYGEVYDVVNQIDGNDIVENVVIEFKDDVPCVFSYSGQVEEQPMLFAFLATVLPRAANIVDFDASLFTRPRTPWPYVRGDEIDRSLRCRPDWTFQAYVKRTLTGTEDMV